MKPLFLISLVLASVACSPEGELTRTLHAPHPKYLDRLGPGADTSPKHAAAKIPEVKLDPGLPDNCRSAGLKPLCLSCDESGIFIYRCYDFQAVFQAENDCHHDLDTIKCLVKDPPFALYLDYKSSEEKFFRENLKTWINSVHQIWDEKFTEEEKLEADRLIAALEVLSDIFTSQTVREDSDNRRFFTAFEVKKEQEGRALAFLAQLERQRLAGKLKITEVLKEFGELIQQTHGPSPLFEKFSTMSLEGLDD